MRPLFGADLTVQAQNAPVSAATLVSCKMAGRAVTKVVHRCNDAKFTSKLDLSDCQLMQVPDAVYHLLRDQCVLQISISQNVIARLPPKFPLKFSLITKLDLSQNKIRNLPDEFSECTELATLDISHNAFDYLPSCIFKLPSLRCLKANNNHITEVDTERLARKPLLTEIHLQENPINPQCRRALESASAPINRTHLQVHLSPPPLEMQLLEELLADLKEEEEQRSAAEPKPTTGPVPEKAADATKPLATAEEPSEVILAKEDASTECSQG